MYGKGMNFAVSSDQLVLLHRKSPWKGEGQSQKQFILSVFVSCFVAWCK